MEAIMLNPTGLLADALGRNLAETYRRIYGDQEPRMAHALDGASVFANAQDADLAG